VPGHEPECEERDDERREDEVRDGERSSCLRPYPICRW
jgi:hypothetical protein